MTVSKRVLPVAMALCVTPAWGQANRREPHIGYLYPSGGQQGTAFEVTVGGQFLRGVRAVYVSGEGVSASVVQHYRPLGNVNKEQRDALDQRLRTLAQKRLAELSRDGRRLSSRGRAFLKNRTKSKRRRKATKKKGEKKNKQNATKTKPVKLPAHPLLRNLEDKSLQELQHVRNQLLHRRRRQPNAQIAESVVLAVTIAADAAPGDRELRLATPNGLTNPMCFEVGLLPEMHELEPNDPNAVPLLAEAPRIELPILVNGQITPGDVDRFRFRARRGQRLVIEARARHLIPYLADAVPGWFQATLALYDSHGKEVAFTDDYRFDPDPVLLYRVREAGEYSLEIKDALYRGREDFVYRIAVGQQPFITQVFPLGGRAGVQTFASIGGWNLPAKRLPLDTGPGTGAIRQTALRRKKRLSNRVSYAVDTLPECNDTEPNDLPQNAQRIDLPRIVNGRIGRAGDVDVFRFEGGAGDEVVADVLGRRLRSPLDSLLRLTDASGRVLAWNDDYEDTEGHLHRDPGFITHHADSYLRARLPEDGTYYVHVADSEHHGGEAYGYRLRIGPPRPDFALRVTPSSINVRAGLAAPLGVHALRQDGFDGEIELVLKDAPAGFTLHGGRIPAGRDHIRMTLTAPRRPLDGPVVLRLEGRARIGGQTVHRPVAPAEDMMQAFLFRHLVPSQELMVAVLGKRRGQGPLLELVDGGSVRIPLGGSARVRVKTPKRPMRRDIQLELREPPAGVTLQDVTIVGDGLAFVLKADATAAQVGLVDNLIVEAFTKVGGRKAGGKKRRPARRVSLGVLPAVPFEIVSR